MGVVLVLVVGQCLPLVFTETEAPRGVVVRRAVGHSVGPVGKAVEVAVQFLARHGGVHGHAVADHVKVAALEVDDPIADHRFGMVSHVGLMERVLCVAVGG